MATDMGELKKLMGQLELEQLDAAACQSKRDIAAMHILGLCPAVGPASQAGHGKYDPEKGCTHCGMGKNELGDEWARARLAYQKAQKHDGDRQKEILCKVMRRDRDILLFVLRARLAASLPSEEGSEGVPNA